MNEIEIKDWYAHEHSPSVFIMFTNEYKVIWCPSGNELRQVYLEKPENFIPGPIEVAIPKHLDETLRDYNEDF